MSLLELRTPHSVLEGYPIQDPIEAKVKANKGILVGGSVIERCLSNAWRFEALPAGLLCTRS